MKGDSVYLQHILDAIDKIVPYVSVGYDDFMERFDIAQKKRSDHN